MRRAVVCGGGGFIGGHLNSLIGSLLGWEPLTPLRSGMEITYRWIYDEMASSTRTDPLTTP